MFSFINSIFWYIQSPEQISFCLRVLMPEVMIVILMSLISALVGIGLIMKGIQLGICFYYYFEEKLKATECIVLDTQLLYIFIGLMILILLSKIHEKLFSNICNVCGRRISNPFSRSHIESAFHQEKLGRRVRHNRSSNARFQQIESDFNINDNKNEKDD